MDQHAHNDSVGYDELNGEAKKWFSETYTCCKLAPMRWSTPIKQVLYHQRSKSGQDVFVFKSKALGNVLAINGTIQMSESDEFHFQEICTHVPLNCHPNPKDVLIIGGGGGGLAREVLKHECVESVTVAELDEEVQELAKLYFPKVSCKLSDPKVHLHICDGVEFIRDCKEQFDVVLIETK